MPPCQTYLPESSGAPPSLQLERGTSNGYQSMAESHMKGPFVFPYASTPGEILQTGKLERPRKRCMV